MKGIEITKENLDAAAASVPENTPCLLLNLLRFKEQATYAPGEDFEPCSGREAYFKRYIPVFLELAASRPEIKPFYFSKVLAGLTLSEEEKWDNCALVSYPDLKSFRDIIDSRDYIAKALRTALPQSKIISLWSPSRQNLLNIPILILPGGPG